MSKFKIGDKVVVKYVPGLEHRYTQVQLQNRYPELTYTQTVESISLGDDPTIHISQSDFCFCNNSLEFVQ